MNINIIAKKTVARDSFRERAEKKLQKLDRYFDDSAQATILLTHEGEQEIVEVTIPYRGMFYRAEKAAADRLEALDLAVDSLTRQIIKNKTRLEKRLRSAAFIPVEPAPIADPLPQEEDEELRVVRAKRFLVKPMAVEEAILQMNLLGHAFYMFQNAETGEMNVVYRRKRGDYGLIEPQMDEEE